jgi:hypothetical protein
MSEQFQNVTCTYVSITIVQGLKNVSLNVWEELITQSMHHIKDTARPPSRHSPFY